MNYIVLTGYDLVAFLYIGKLLPRLKVVFASFLAYAIANTVGFGMLSGASVRYRFYTRWGVTGEELSRIVFSYSVTFWLGLLALGGLSLAVAPLPATPGLPAHQVVAPVGWALAADAGRVRACLPLEGGDRFDSGASSCRCPRCAIATAQLLLSSVDWALAGAVLFVLLPPSPLTFLQFLALFFIAILLGLASHVPGGLGVFETLMVLLLKPYLTSGQLLPALVVVSRGVLPRSAGRGAGSRCLPTKRINGAPMPRASARCSDGSPSSSRRASWLP